MIDNSSAFRRDPDVPLVVSEVNPHALRDHRGLIANPNCSTMQLMVALAPIHRAVGIERLIVSTYQSVSGTGKKAVDELDAQARASLHGVRDARPAIYPDHIAFNVIGAAGNFAEGDDHTDEERKMMFETRKILEDESIGVAVTCVRVPVRICHSEAVNFQTREPLTPTRRASCWPAPGRGLSSTCPRRCAPPGAMRCSSGASAATSPIPGRCRCGWCPTTCARARPPTRCRSPSCWSPTPPRAPAGRRRAVVADAFYEIMRCAPSTRYFTGQSVDRDTLTGCSTTRGSPPAAATARAGG